MDGNENEETTVDEDPVVLNDFDTVNENGPEDDPCVRCGKRRDKHGWLTGGDDTREIKHDFVEDGCMQCGVERSVHGPGLGTPHDYVEYSPE